jgi:hypothetical protein
MIWSGAGANETDLVRHIRESLNAVGKEEQKLSEPDWFPRIASTIATNVSSIGLKCYAKGSYHHVTARDFSAFIDDDDKTVPKKSYLSHKPPWWAKSSGTRMESTTISKNCFAWIRLFAAFVASLKVCF